MKKDELLSVNKAADLLEKDRQTIVRALRGVEPDGIEMKQARYKLSTIMKALEAPRPSGGKSQEAGLTEARAELAREQAASVALKNAVARGEFVSLAGVRREVETMLATFRERVLSIPGKVAASCEMRSRGEVEEIVRDELYEALDELSRPVAGGSGDDQGNAGGSADGNEAAPEAESD
jgi:hypothetical protein